jgi:hypothetical protein
MDICIISVRVLYKNTELSEQQHITCHTSIALVTCHAPCLAVLPIVCSMLESESYVMTDGQPASLSWNKAHFWGLRPDLYSCLTVEGFVERTGLSFTIAAGPCQQNSLP